MTCKAMVYSIDQQPEIGYAVSQHALNVPQSLNWWYRGLFQPQVQALGRCLALWRPMLCVLPLVHDVASPMLFAHVAASVGAICYDMLRVCKRPARASARIRAVQGASLCLQVLLISSLCRCRYICCADTARVNKQYFGQQGQQVQPKVFSQRYWSMVKHTLGSPS